MAYAWSTAGAQAEDERELESLAPVRLPDRCRLCHAPPNEPCVNAGSADRSDDYRAKIPHHLRLIDAGLETVSRW